MIFFRENGMQRRHMMSSTLFISQTDDHAKISQYAMLVSTNKKTKVDAIDELNSRAVSYNTRIISPIVYTFELKKTGDLWRISRRSLRLDKPLDFALSGKANSSKWENITFTFAKCFVHIFNSERDLWISVNLVTWKKRLNWWLIVAQSGGWSIQLLLLDRQRKQFVRNILYIIATRFWRRCCWVASVFWEGGLWLSGLTI